MRNEPFKAREIKRGTFLIETGAVCYPYLLIGEKEALVIDSGMNKQNIRAYLETITDLPMKVVNTHGHGDHAYADGFFDRVYMQPDGMQDVNYGKVSELGYPDFKPEPVREGDVFDLGGRHVEVLEIPCHSPGDIALLDHENRILFTGDNLESGQILLFYGTDKIGASIKRHLKIMEKLKERYDEFDMICPAHNGSPLDKIYLDYAIDIDQRILNGEEGTAELWAPTFNNKKMDWGVDEKYVRCFMKNGVSIVYDTRRITDSEGLWHSPFRAL